jgi:hypothetical protein
MDQPRITIEFSIKGQSDPPMEVLETDLCSICEKPIKRHTKEELWACAAEERETRPYYPLTR